MNIFYEEHASILKQLIKLKVDFMLVGGYAVIYHGYNRVTGDMDIWVKPDNDNKKKLIEALSQLEFDKAGLDVIASWDFQHPHVFHIGKIPERTDFMTHISGVKYEVVKQNAIHANIDGLQFYIIQLSNLIENKKLSGRLKDLADVEYLEKIMQLRKQKD